MKSPWHSVYVYVDRKLSLDKRAALARRIALYKGVMKCTQLSLHPSIYTTNLLYVKLDPKIEVLMLMGRIIETDGVIEAKVFGLAK